MVSRQLVEEREAWVELRATELARWDQAFPEPSLRGGLEDLVVAGVRAGVVAREGELERWFCWRSLWRSELADDLVRSGRLYRPEPGWVAAS